MLVVMYFQQQRQIEQMVEMKSEMARMNDRFAVMNEKVIIMWSGGKWSSSHQVTE
jgi:hypothetical protein